MSGISHRKRIITWDQVVRENVAGSDLFLQDIFRRKAKGQDEKAVGVGSWRAGFNTIEIEIVIEIAIDVRALIDPDFDLDLDYAIYWRGDEGKDRCCSGKPVEVAGIL